MADRNTGMAFRSLNALPPEPVAFRCCMTTPDPGPWTAGKNDSADPSMIKQMHNIRDRLSYKMPLDDFIWTLKASAQIDSRTMLGGDLQRCLLHNAAHHLEILAKQIDPDAIWRTRGWPRLADAWAVFCGRAVVTYIRDA